MFNKFYNYITGLINNRFVYQGPEAPKPPEADEASQEVADEQDAVKAAYEDVAKSGADAAKAAADAATKLEEPGPIPYNVEDKYRNVPHRQNIMAGKLEPTRAPGKEEQEAEEEPEDEILDKAEKLAAEQQVDKEMAELGILPKEEKPAPKYTSAEELAIASNTAEQAGAANEFAYIAQQMENPTDYQIRDWVGYAKSLGDKLSADPGADIDSIVHDMQESMPERDLSNIGYMGQLAVFIG